MQPAAAYPDQRITYRYLVKGADRVVREMFGM